MAKKNKNKGGKPQQQFKAAAPVQKITAEIKESAAELEAKITEKEESSGDPVEVKDTLSAESAAKAEQAEKKEDVAGYLKYLRELNVRIDAQLERAAKMAEEAKAERDKVVEERKEFEKEQEQFKQNRAELEQKIIEHRKRADELDNRGYSEIIHTLLESLEESQAKVLEGTKERIEAISELHTKTMAAMQANQEELSKLEEEKLSIQKQMRELKRERIKFDLEKSSLKADTEEECEAKYQAEMESLKDDLSRTKAKNARLERENETLRGNLEKINAAFDNESPDEMVQMITLYKEQVQDLEEELNNRPAKFVLEQKEEMISVLKRKVAEFEDKVNEEVVGELRVRLANADNYSIERMALKGEKEALETKLKHYEWRHNNDLELIEMLKGEEKKKEDVFEFAMQADRNPHLNQETFVRREIEDLPSLVSYIQGRMIASRQDNGKAKPFYYDNKTIRIFLAGLHMSPITILQGISGTGKTSLPIEFAKALLMDEQYTGINEAEKYPNASYRVCSIQSGWRDDMDLMGYYNSFDKKYKETDFFKALYVANLPKYSDTLFFIILDEMNLSRPEHYFAEFLSKMELPEGGRYIPIRITNTRPEAFPKKISFKDKSLCIPKNVRFIGTANHDETTLEFAPKTYDRSNLMEMPKNLKYEGSPEDGKFNVSYEWLEQQFALAMRNHKTECGQFNKFINDSEFKNKLKELNIGVGNRFEQQAERFISVYLASGKNKKKDLAVAADHLITSRLFRTLRDNIFLSGKRLERFLDWYETLFELYFDGEAPDIAIQMLKEEIDKKEHQDDSGD